MQIFKKGSRYSEKSFMDVWMEKDMGQGSYGMSTKELIRGKIATIRLPVGNGWFCDRSNSGYMSDMMDGLACH